MSHTHKLIVDVPRQYPNVGRNSLLKALRISRKIPLELEGVWSSVPVKDAYREYHEDETSFTELTIKINASIPSAKLNLAGRPRKVSTNRIFAQCPNCGHFIPSGRLRQHTMGEVRRYLKTTLRNEYRITRPDHYYHNDSGRMQGHYILAYSEAEARERARKMFPEDKSFNIQLWKEKVW